MEFSRFKYQRGSRTTVIADRFTLYTPGFSRSGQNHDGIANYCDPYEHKIRDDWMNFEQQLRLAIMDSIGHAIRHIIVPPPLVFQNMSISDIIEAVRFTYGKTTRHTIKRVKEILSEKLDNVRSVLTEADPNENWNWPKHFMEVC
jgi:hypothetical protein